MNDYIGYYRLNNNFEVTEASNGYIMQYDLIEVVSIEDGYMDTEVHELKMLTSKKEDVSKTVADWLELGLWEEVNRKFNRTKNGE